MLVGKQVTNKEEHQVLTSLLTNLFVRSNQQPETRDQISAENKEEIETKKKDVNQENKTVVENQNPVDVARFDKYLDAFYTKLNKNLKARMLEPMTINFEQLDKEIVYTMNENIQSLEFYDGLNKDDDNKFSERRGKDSKEKEKGKIKKNDKKTRVGCIDD